jgi:hypothetical protein
VLKRKVSVPFNPKGITTMLRVYTQGATKHELKQTLIDMGVNAKAVMDVEDDQLHVYGTPDEIHDLVEKLEMADIDCLITR